MAGVSRRGRIQHPSRRRKLDSLFLGCFAFGLIFTVASFLLGALGGGSDHFHLPDFFGGHGHGGHVGHVGHAGAGGAHGHGHGDGPQMSVFNISVISAFITWFGAAGWVLTRYSSLAGLTITLVATAAGVVGGGIVFVTLAKFVLPRLTIMRDADYVEQGTVGRLTQPIREGGTGEVVYELGGARRVDGARTVDGAALDKGTEVMIHRVEKGIAYVEKWDEFARKNQLPAGPAAPRIGES